MTIAALGGCTQPKETAMTPEDAAVVVRTEARAMATALGHNVTDYRESFVPCEPPLENSSAFTVSMRLVSDPDRASGMRSGHLAGRQSAGWTLRDDNSPEHLGWTIKDARGFHIGYFVFADKGYAATLSGSGPCLPTPSPTAGTAGTAGTTPTQPWTDAP